MYLLNLQPERQSYFNFYSHVVFLSGYDHLGRAWRRRELGSMEGMQSTVGDWAL